jgi:hypothetical protein
MTCSGGRGACQQERVEGYIFEKADFEANGHNLAQIGGGGEVFSAGTEIGEREMPGPRQLKAGGYDGCIEVKNGAKLNFEAKLNGVRRERLAAEYPASTIGQRRGKVWQQAVAFFVAEALDIKGLHCVMEPPRLEISAVKLFIGEEGQKRDPRPCTMVM